MLDLYNADNRTIGVILDEFFSAKVVRAVHARNQLQEVLVDFWFNHFNVFVNDGFDRYSISSYERDAIRPHVLGRFRELLGAVTLHPAMLYYLDNYLNTVPRTQGGRPVGGINENHGRELLELHTVGVDAGYTQTDVVEASRCLTGHGIDNLGTTGNYLYRAGQPRQRRQAGVRPRGGGRRRRGRRPAAARLPGRAPGHRALHLEASWRSASSRTTRPRRSSRGWPTSSCARTATCARSRGRSSAAPSSGPRRSATGKPKTGFEYVVSTLRAAGAEVQNTRVVRTAIQDAGMPLYACNPPTGYSNRGADWLNPSAQLYRMNFGLDLAAGAVAGVAVDIRGLIRSGGGDPDNPSSAAEAINRVVFGRTLSRRVARRGGARHHLGRRAGRGARGRACSSRAPRCR